MMDEKTVSPAVVLAGVPAPAFLDEVEAIVVSLQCALRDALSPDQFQIVQDLCRATQVIAVSHFTLLEPAA